MEKMEGVKTVIYTETMVQRKKYQEKQRWKNRGQEKVQKYLHIFRMIYIYLKVAKRYPYLYLHRERQGGKESQTNSEKE